MNLQWLLIKYSVPFWIILSFLLFFVIIFGVIVWLFWITIKKFTSDVLIFYDKNDRWTLIYDSVKGKELFKYGNKDYYLKDEGGTLNKRGKALYHFTENKPEPLKIKHGKFEWLSAESLKAVIDNKIVQQIVRPRDKFIDFLLLFGAIGGILAAISSVIVLLISTGVIKLNP